MCGRKTKLLDYKNPNTMKTSTSDNTDIFPLINVTKYMYDQHKLCAPIWDSHLQINISNIEKLNTTAFMLITHTTTGENRETRHYCR